MKERLSDSREKPLHVRVAEALGCVPYPHDDRWFCDQHKCRGGANVRYPNGPHCDGAYGALPEYDTDWSATGPLIERFEINLTCDKGIWWASTEQAPAPYPTIRQTTGAPNGPLSAVCNLLLHLAQEKRDDERAGIAPAWKRGPLPKRS